MNAPAGVVRNCRLQSLMPCCCLHTVHCCPHAAAIIHCFSGFTAAYPTGSTPRLPNAALPLPVLGGRVPVLPLPRQAPPAQLPLSFQAPGPQHPGCRPLHPAGRSAAAWVGGLAGVGHLERPGSKRKRAGECMCRRFEARLLSPQMPDLRVERMCLRSLP